MSDYRIVDEVLQPVRANELTAQSLMSQIEQADRIIRKYTGMTLGKPAEKIVTDTLEKLGKYEQRLNACIDVLVERREHAEKYLNTLDGEEHAVIYAYYFAGKAWRKIAAETYMSDRRVFLLRKRALDKLEQAYNKEEQGSGQ